MPISYLGTVYPISLYLENTLPCIVSFVDNKKRRRGWIANDTTLHKTPNDTSINNYRSPYSFQQPAKLILHCEL